MKLMRTEDAVGQVLCHDITQIIRGVTKDAVFRKGHIITPEDIPVLLSVGKDHIYVWENDETMYHEDEAAEILRDICMSAGMSASKPKEGKIELTAEYDGLFLVNREKLRAVNSLGRMMIATRPGGVAVKAGDKLCGTRIIPLVIEKEAMERAKEAAGPEPILSLKPLKAKKFGVVTTGNEVFYGRIEGHLHARHRRQAGRLRLRDDRPRGLKRRPRAYHRLHQQAAGRGAARWCSAPAA